MRQNNHHLSLFQLLRDRSDRWTWLYKSRAHPRALCAVWPGPLRFHLAGVEVFQSVQPSDRSAGPRTHPKRGALWGHAAQHAVMDFLMRPLSGHCDHRHLRVSSVLRWQCHHHNFYSLGFYQFSKPILFYCEIRLIFIDRIALTATKSSQTYCSIIAGDINLFYVCIYLFIYSPLEKML